MSTISNPISSFQGIRINSRNIIPLRESDSFVPAQPEDHFQKTSHQRLGVSLNQKISQKKIEFRVQSFDELLPKFNEWIAYYEAKMESENSSEKKAQLKEQLRAAIHKAAEIPPVYQAQIQLTYEVGGKPCYFDELNSAIDKDILRLLNETTARKNISIKANKILEKLDRIYADYEENKPTAYTRSLKFTKYILQKIDVLISEFAPQKDSKHAIWWNLKTIQGGLNMVMDCADPTKISHYTTMPPDDEKQLKFFRSMVSSSVMRRHTIRVSTHPSPHAAFSSLQEKRINICRPLETLCYHAQGFSSLMVHELLHFMEVNPWILKNVQDQLNAYCTQDTSQTEGASYRKCDWGKEVEGIDYRAGGIYIQKGKIIGTEFPSMIGQKFYEDPVSLIKKAPHLARIFINLLRGVAVVTK